MLQSQGSTSIDWKEWVMSIQEMLARELLDQYNLALVGIGPDCAATMPISEYIAMMKRFTELEKEVMFRLVG
jgi:hypothetical protein